MDTIHLFGSYHAHGTDVEELVQQRVGYCAMVESVLCATKEAKLFGVDSGEWNTPYKFVLCPQADAQGIAVQPDENTFFIETFRKTPAQVARQIAELYTHQ